AHNSVDMRICSLARADRFGQHLDSRCHLVPTAIGNGDRIILKPGGNANCSLWLRDSRVPGLGPNTPAGIEEAALCDGSRFCEALCSRLSSSCRSCQGKRLAMVACTRSST